MKIIAAKIYALRIPFVEAFSHSTKSRRFSDSFVVRLTSDDGTNGYGEGAARPYVTGETAETSVEHIKTRLFPIVSSVDYPEISVGNEALKTLAPVSESFPNAKSAEGIVWNAAESAVELAVIDCLLKRRKLSITDVLPPQRDAVIYSGVITSGTIEKAVQHAKRFKLFGIKSLKIKIDGENDAERVAAVREAVGADVSLRLDANGVFSVDEAIAVAAKLAIFNIESIEQPIARGSIADLARVRKHSPIPIMADESLVTAEDARALVAAEACGFFNLRVSKCGGIGRTLEIARMAERAGIDLQIGCQVGETAILSAAGRCVAAYLENVRFVEGSFGNLLLAEDIGRDSVNFGHGGRAKVLRGQGFGVTVRDEILEKYAVSTVTLGKE